MNNADIIRLAIAEDHALVRQGMIGLLERSGQFIFCAEAHNGKELIEKMNNVDALPDICLLDINMPVMDGFETTKRILGKWPDIKILALTAFQNELCVRKMFRCGAHGFVSKITPSHNLINALRALHLKGFYHANLEFNVFRNVSNTGLDKELSEKELIFLSLCCNDMSYKEIAVQMNTSARTAEFYRASLFSKLKVKSRAGLISFALKTGIFSVT